MRIFVLTATYELRVSRKNHLRDHPTPFVDAQIIKCIAQGKVTRKGEVK
jgi:hypothetical protein